MKPGRLAEQARDAALKEKEDFEKQADGQRQRAESMHSLADQMSSLADQQKKIAMSRLLINEARSHGENLNTLDTAILLAVEAHAFCRHPRAMNFCEVCWRQDLESSGTGP